jgi:PhzF family phenazine biosynthesis protein
MSFSRKVFQKTVFSSGPGGGNPCPVVLDADGLSTQQGMSLAEKFMAETVLVTSARTPQASLGLRYFVPRHEMNMCVHGTIAAVKVLHDLKKIATSPVQIETTMGRISAEWSENNENIIVTVNQFAPAFSATNPTAQEVAKVLRLPDTSSIRVDLPLVSVSTSRHKLIVPLTSIQVLDHLRPDFGALWSLCDRYSTTGLYPFAPVSMVADSAHAARQFPKRVGYFEDPATGVAACALGAYLTQYCANSEGWNSFEILQGYAMGRPSRLMAKVLLEGGKIRQTSVTGKADILNRGRIPIVL